MPALGKGVLHVGTLLTLRTKWFSIIMSSGRITVASLCRYSAAPQEHRRRREQPLATLASLYVHIMIRRYVPSLATEMHLTIRLLHVHSDVARSSSDATLALAQDCREGPFPSGRSVEICPLATETKSVDEIDKPQAKVVFSTGVDCRSFAANVLLGLKCLLPHIGTDTLDLLAESLALASQVNYMTPNYH